MSEEEKKCIEYLKILIQGSKNDFEEENPFKLILNLINDKQELIRELEYKLELETTANCRLVKENEQLKREQCDVYVPDDIYIPDDDDLPF